VKCTLTPNFVAISYKSGTQDTLGWFQDWFWWNCNSWQPYIRVCWNVQVYLLFGLQL